MLLCARTVASDSCCGKVALSTIAFYRKVTLKPFLFDMFMLSLSAIRCVRCPVNGLFSDRMDETFSLSIEVVWLGNEERAPPALLCDLMHYNDVLLKNVFGVNPLHSFYPIFLLAHYCI